MEAIVAIGNAFDGLIIVGPFLHVDEAMNWAHDNEHVIGCEWTVSEMRDPEGYLPIK